MMTSIFRFLRRRPAARRVQLCHHELCGIAYPIPAVELGWLHVRMHVGTWEAVRLIERLGSELWLSAYRPDESSTGDEAGAAELGSLQPVAVAGFWPTGGFVELIARPNVELEDNARFQVRVFAGSAARAAALLEELGAAFLVDDVPRAGDPRIALVNHSYGSLEVQRVPMSAAQLVPRKHVDLYYGDGMSAWVDAWAARLAERRYGLTILSGEPGTGKTTLLRSMSAWLSRTHALYFMPASRFGAVDAGELVTFWVGENRLSKLRSVLVLEDAESILLRREGDNRERVAALLNLTDGVMGDALGLQIVCTLNSDLADLDPALLRPGRLLAQRGFDRLDPEAAARLASHLGRACPEGRPVSLAELFNPRDLLVDPHGGFRRARVGF